MGRYSYRELYEMGIQVPKERLEQSPDQKIMVSNAMLETLKASKSNWVEAKVTPAENNSIRTDVQAVVDELKAKGITDNTQEHEVVGLGDLVEGVLKKVGITEERFKAFFNLQECGCKDRKKFLNGILSWYKNKS